MVDYQNIGKTNAYLLQRGMRRQEKILYFLNQVHFETAG